MNREITFTKPPGRQRRRTPVPFIADADDWEGIADAVLVHIARHRRLNVEPTRVTIWPGCESGMVQRAEDCGPVILWEFTIREMLAGRDARPPGRGAAA